MAKNVKKRQGHFDYLIVSEYHKDGKSLHFHALMKNYTGKLKDSGVIQKGRKIYNLTGYKLGHSTAAKIDNVEKVANYVSKYITKDMPRFPGKHRYWASKNLKKPFIEDNPSSWYLKLKPLRAHESEYGLTLYVAREDAEKEMRRQRLLSMREAYARLFSLLIAPRSEVWL